MADFCWFFTFVAPQRRRCMAATFISSHIDRGEVIVEVAAVGGGAGRSTRHGSGVMTRLCPCRTWSALWTHSAAPFAGAASNRAQTSVRTNLEL